ncbi:MAG: glycoside hydrolase family 10 protein, partial [Myxococcota bacterium]
LFLWGGMARAQNAPRPRLGLWMECDGKFRTLDDPERIRAAVSSARALGATDLFVQVFRNGKAWFATELADDAPYRRAKARGFAPLAEMIARAHARHIRVHAWVNLLRVDDGAETALVRALGRDSVLTDATGRSLLDPGPWGKKRNTRPDTPGAWLDPASPVVVARLTALLAALIEAYPSLDGIHLDYVRYPFPIGSGGRSADLGWSKGSRSRFLADLGPQSGRGTRSQWDDWRREKLTVLLRSIRESAKRKKPSLEVSAAVLADPREAIDRSLQDWPEWTREGLLDLAVPMNYHADALRFDSLARACVRHRGKADVLMGVGAWRFGGRVGAIAARVDLALAAGAQGAVLFSHDNLKSHPGALPRLGALLRAEVLPEKPDATPSD